MSDLESRTRFEPAEVESRITERWLSSGLFHPEPEGSPQENYSIAIPPPNVTGALHMGHALNGTIQDTLIRLARMEGRRAKWILGTDHAGIATQKQVEQLLEREGGPDRKELGREAFTERVWQWREQYGDTIVQQFKRLGASADYEAERFTLDDDYAAAVQHVFVTLYEKGLIYRDNRMVNWDPGLGSAISDLEVEEREVTDAIYSIAYPLDGGGEIVVATVRPETMLADTAVAVNPHDERYRDLIGRRAILPLVGRELPIIADDYVKVDFGTGALKITPGHDPNDFEIGRRHGLEEITVIGEDGRMTAEAGEYAGLSVEDARTRVVAELEALGLVREQRPYTHEVPFSHRSGARVEPLISLQWFMRMEPLAAPAIEAVKDGRVRFVPERWSRVYLQWMEEIRPWCVSRQLWWGHQIPVWYRGEETYCGMTAPEGDGWERDPDVLDTWFSSALWPFATLGWPNETPELKAFYPTNVVSTARDIIFLWVARMIMMGLEFRGEIPFEDVYIHSVIQAPDGRRMSKSLGTGIDPLEVIDAHGADATRFGLLAMSSTQDVRYSAEKVEQGQRLANKLFNASRFVLLRVGEDVQPAPMPATVEDRWILSRLQRAKRATHDAIRAYEFHHAALGLYEFVFEELCDRYIELVKPRLDDDDVQATLLFVLRETLAMAHPIIPFVTEEIWSYLPASDGGLLAAAPYPQTDLELLDEEAEAAVERQFEAVGAVRAWRQAVGVPPGPRLRARVLGDGFDGILPGIALLARLDVEAGDEEPAATIQTAAGTIAILQSDAVDLDAHAKRTDEQRLTLLAEIKRAEGKLSNAGFTDKAPAPVVQAERDKLERLKRELAECSP
jgi:valyl-tRNA synthetase